MGAPLETSGLSLVAVLLQRNIDFVLVSRRRIPINIMVSSGSEYAAIEFARSYS